MPTPPPPRIAIIGAGPGGLTCARVLQRHGIAATVHDLDSSPAARDQGGTLDLHPGSGQEALRAAGLLDEFLALSRPEGQQMRLAAVTAASCSTRSRPRAARSWPRAARSLPEAARSLPGATRHRPGATRSLPGATRHRPGATRHRPGAAPPAAARRSTAADCAASSWTPSPPAPSSGTTGSPPWHPSATAPTACTSPTARQPTRTSSWGPTAPGPRCGACCPVRHPATPGSPSSRPV
ncbi:FAD-dependent monooxygenase [Streptomyces tricolor]|uniref:FAD-dependent oxidoreductase n=1 Tax=Streptomyces tricolor TaxID=68277 RepID=UPI00381EACE6